MAVRTVDHPDGVGPVPTSPNVYQSRDHLDRWIRISVPWALAGDGTTKNIQAAITTHRDVGCLYARALIGGTVTAPIAEGNGVLLPADLGQTTLNALEFAGVTFEP